MKHPIILLDDSRQADLLPFTFTRPVWDLRMGIFTQKERWEATLGSEVFTLAAGHLASVFTHLPSEKVVLTLNSGIFPDEDLVRLIDSLDVDEYAVDSQGTWIAACVPLATLISLKEPVDADFWEEQGLRSLLDSHTHLSIRFPEDIFRYNAEAILRDFPLATKAAPSQKLNDPHTRVYGQDNLYLAPGARVKAAIINAEDGPIYLGPNSTVSEGAIIVRSHAICDHATVAMGAKLRGDTTVGPWSKVGGEVSNSVLMAYSNKGHDGYLGNSVLGQWCNLGADTNNSNLKNNYANVKLWHYPSGRFRDTGLQFCGLMMGDHSKCGINTMFNTGTVVGVSANIFGQGFPRNFVPSFSWGGASGFTTYQFGKALEVARMVKDRRGKSFTQDEVALMQAVFDKTAVYRRS
ncbi:MAG: GlmU family protein [Bacteroidia bacterium]|nr:GlmU family protein [Bacteroidia bacterium]